MSEQRNFLTTQRTPDDIINGLQPDERVVSVDRI